MKSGIQVDLISPVILKEGRLSQDHLRIRHRFYNAVIYPYPGIMDPQVLELIAVMKRMNFEVHLGGESPYFTTTGKRIPHHFAVSFDPEDDDLSPLKNGKVSPMIHAPENSLVTKVLRGVETYYMIRPYGVNGSVRGEVIDGRFSFFIPRSEGLVIYHRDVKDRVMRIELESILSAD